ncbi:hypothetical protein EX30DRAFT_372226 [Ascodesmis nigricans]|uniref:Microtubule associated protein n=1 Tax=Ascodesmis nigricans TaxID=341454 RepID=A0A4V3SIL0_9PEZI|nr:hypothetical protein EX30DRAFT_372226 [Ascodesmis nigricans]
MDNATLADELTTVIDGLHGLFDEIGLARYEREERETRVYAALNAALQEQLRVVEREKNDLVNQCHDIITQICQMERSLADNENEIDERRFRITSPLMQCLQDLQEKQSVVKRRHAERYESIKQLVKALDTYASRLEPSFLQIALPPITDDSSTIGSFDLSHSYSAQLDEEFNRVYSEYMKRLSIVQTVAKEIINLYSELGIPSAQIDRHIVEYGANDPEKLGLERSDIDRLKEKKQKLIDERERRRARVETLKEEIAELWVKLQVEENSQRRFLAQNRGCDLKCIRNLEDELDRLLELKRENLNVFVEDCRAQIRELWEQLYYSESERAEFTPMNSNVYTDALLQTHEMQIAALQDTLRERAPILELINKHKDLMKDKEELAISSQDSSRLLGRGRHDPTRLLREEKMRKRIAKELPKVELDLKKMLEDWDEEYGFPFTVYGDDYLETLRQLSPVVQSRTNSVKSSNSNLRGRSNTVGATSTTASARARSKSRAAAKDIARSKTPTARPRTPANGLYNTDTIGRSNTLDSVGRGTIGRNTGRALTSAASQYSSSSSTGPSSVSRTGSIARPKTPGLSQPRQAANNVSPTRIARPALTNTFPTPSTGGGTIGRNSAIKRKMANPTLAGTPTNNRKMNTLRPTTRQEDYTTPRPRTRQDDYNTIPRPPSSRQTTHAPIPSFNHFPTRHTSSVSNSSIAGSVRSIRSISPAESANYEVYPATDDEDDDHASNISTHSNSQYYTHGQNSYQDATPRPPTAAGRESRMLRLAPAAPITPLRSDRESTHSVHSVASIASISSAHSTQSIRSVRSVRSVIPHHTNNNTNSSSTPALDPRKYSSGTDSNSTSSTLERSNSVASENWETFGGDSEDEGVGGYAGRREKGYGGIGHGYGVQGARRSGEVGGWEGREY